MESPSEILDIALTTASAHLDDPLVDALETIERVKYVVRNEQNRAGVRLLMAALLAKIHQPEIDIRKPYTEIGTSDAYSGRTYDESYITDFIMKHNLPCNHTTAFLTPALRNRNITLTPDINLVGRPPKVYEDTLQLLTEVHTGQVSAEALLAETLRSLILYRDYKRLRLKVLLEGLNTSGNSIPLSAEAIVTLIQQHLATPHSSRLPVLVVAAAYGS
ncbi:MAG TPA: hypothetical protein PKJ56_04310, partial [Promineifilum sp.]|nr:hypothetical protein [Promineifilum sp.]